MKSTTFLLVLLGVIAVAYASSICQCSSASGNAGYIGEVTVSSCNNCNASACPNMTEYVCPYIYGATSGSSCTSDLAQFKIDSVKYTIEDTFSGPCNQSECCCLVGNVVITKKGSTIEISGSAKGEQCTSDTVSISYNSPLAGETFLYFQNFIGNGPTMITTLTTGGVLFETHYPSCYIQAKAEKTGLSTGEKAGIAIGVILAIAIVAGVVIFFIRRRRGGAYQTL